MKACSPELRAHYAQGSTTISRQWRFERTDGEIVTVTTCSRDLLYLGEVYRTKDGINPTAISQQVGAAVTNSEATGTLSEDLATEAEFLSGLWDGCRYTIFEVNYRDLSMGHMVIGSGTLGDLKVGRSAFTAEMRGIAQALQQTNGKVVTKNCTAQFGDDRCKVNLTPITVAGAVTGVTNRRTIADSSRAEPSDYFGAGLFRVTGGPMTGEEMEIDSFSAGVFSLVLPLSRNPEVGMTYEAVPGCRKRLAEDCRSKWVNVLNYRGFPNIPGADRVLGLGGTEGTNL
ncbi:DUF2163 domain-containing protein [Variovorax boronicumulans]|uniref:DUF2163 domain-containing protein n=1 Tax=Variovorax boronicumulans TaxID=436515 RepID=UPI001C57FCC7